MMISTTTSVTAAKNRSAPPITAMRIQYGKDVSGEICMRIKRLRWLYP